MDELKYIFPPMNAMNDTLKIINWCLYDDLIMGITIGTTEIINKKQGRGIMEPE
jgi:hypothetical protein